MVSVAALLFFCAPPLAGLCYLAKLYRRSTQPATSEQLWSIAERSQLLGVGLACYTVVVVPVATAVCQFLP